MKVVITSRLSKPRDQLIKEFTNYGIIVLTGMRSNIDYLIADTPNSNTRKTQMARSFGTKIVSELEFRMIIKYIKSLPIINTISTIKASSTQYYNIKSSQKEIELTRYLDF